MKTFLPVLILISLAGSEALSQDKINVTRLKGEIIFDGNPDEEAWIPVQPLKMVTHFPVFNSSPSERSDIRIAYDDNYLYLAGTFFYFDPADMRPIGKKRDYDQPSTDWLGLVLDSFNDRENASGFFTNPNGLRSDATVKNDNANMQEDVNFSWNTFWDVETVIRDSSWSAEMRIPFSSLRFQTIEGKTEMGLIIYWYYPAKSEMVTYPAISPDFQYSFFKPSLSQVITFEGLNPKKPVYVTPYATSGLSRLSELNETETLYETETTPKFDAGLDIKYSLTNNLTMDLTINTDFAQVEADDQKINLSRFSLFFPEKRVFFQEKSDVFDFSFPGINTPFYSFSSNLFYSRRIGIYDDNPVRIFGGVRMTGRINNWDIGILGMQTARSGENPSENFGVFRTKRTVFNKNSFVGGMFTSRLGTNGTYNLVYGIDGQFRVKGDDYLIMKIAQSFESDSVNRILDLTPSRLLLQWQRRTQTGFGYDMSYTYSGRRFNPGIGFELRDDYHGFRSILQYGWLPAADRPVRYHKIMLTGFNYWNTITGLQETFYGAVTWQVEAKKGFMGIATGSWYSENIADSLSLGESQAWILPGSYSFGNISLMYGTSYSHMLIGRFLVDAGSFYDGWKVSAMAMPTLNLGPSFSIGATYNLDIVKFRERSSGFTNNIIGLKSLLNLSTKTSISALIQYNTAVSKVLTNLRFRYNPREGNDFYIVYDDGLNTDLTRETPTLPRSSGRTLLLKYTYTFRF